MQNEYREAIINSFKISGITENDKNRYQTALKHILETNE